MVNKRILLWAVIIVNCLIIIVTIPVLAESPQAPSSAESAGEDYSPSWLKRTNFAIDITSGENPKYFLETIQPLLGSENDEAVFFTQDRISVQNERTVYNFGLGLRRIFKERYLLGVNAFYDYQSLHQHSRGGVGFEARNDIGLEGRLNTYIALSGAHLVEDISGVQTYEEVANGFDAELGGPLPYMPFLKVYGGGYWYDFDQFKNKYGWKVRAEFTPIKYSRINFAIFDDTKSDVDYTLEGAITLAFTSFCWKDIVKDIKGEKAEAYPKINLRDRVLDRVVRDFDITVIRYTEQNGITVEAGNGG